ncbi:hypothetical protein GIB67_018230 [Kingdonia uniflora]|uniref:Semialdehyde dehydrogenase NAD-binding domain-containing protein n=1 Tax=Kingdonia uniflora TaxID=39325 RepID=A0A7J7NMZ3_9MAGN|nr:hypothetical protein GIB67_018230 [Kingdonia uniflora]
MRAPTIAPHHRFLAGSTAFAPNPRITSTRRANFSVRMVLKSDAPSLAVVGVTGAVGQEFLRVLTDRDFPYKSIKMLASKRSAGKHILFEGKDYTIEELTHDSFDGVDIALFSAGGSISKEFGPAAANRGSVVIDNSSAFRMDDSVPLIIPEVNPEAMSHIKLHYGKGALIANPNCSTIICLMAATPLHRHAKLIELLNGALKVSFVVYSRLLKRFLDESRKVEHLDCANAVLAYSNALPEHSRVKEYIVLQKPRTLEDMLSKVGSVNEYIVLQKPRTPLRIQSPGASLDH